MPKLKKTMYPEENETWAAMFLNNLVHPEWITVKCDDSLSPHVLCVFFVQNDSYSQQILPEVEMRVNDKNCVIKNKTCYLFIWQRRDSKTNIKSYKPLKNFKVPFFQFLFDTISVIFPSIFTNDFKSISRYNRYGQLYEYKEQIDHKNATEALKVYTKGQMKDIIIGGDMFKCKENIYISIQYIHDGKVDCPGKYAIGELECQCNRKDEYSAQCKFVTNERGMKLCSVLYLQIKDKTCKINTVTEKVHKTKNPDIVHENAKHENLFQCRMDITYFWNKLMI